MNRGVDTSIRVYSPVIAPLHTPVGDLKAGEHVDAMIKHVLVALENDTNLGRHRGKIRSKRSGQSYTTSDEGVELGKENRVDSPSLHFDESEISDDDNSYITPALETLIKMLMMLFGSNRVVEEEKRKVLSFISELITLSENSSSGELAEDVKTVLLQGLELLRRDSDVSPSDFLALETMILQA